MANRIDVKFPKTCSTLEHVCARRHEFPLVVRTRDKMVTFPECPIETDSKEVLLVEREMALHCALVKVLPFHDERKAVSTFGAELFDLHQLSIGEEFFIPIDCPGSLKVVPYPRRRRQRFTSVTEILKDNPRYVRSNADIVVLSKLNENTGHTYTKRIASGTILETKTVVLVNKSRYLKCADYHGNSFFLPDKWNFDFTGLPDQRNYTLAELLDVNPLLPTAVQFNEGTILPQEITMFGDKMVGKSVTVTSGPLEIVKVLTHNVLITRLQEREGQRSTIALVPAPIYNQFHVQYALFQNADDKSKYLERNFAGSRLDVIECTKHTMYLLPVKDNHVCWLQASTSPIDTEGSLDSSFSGDIAQQTSGQRTRQQPTDLSLSANTADKFRTYREFENRLEELHTIELTPHLKVKDEDTVQRLRRKAKLGFGQIHAELKRFVKRKHKLKPDSASFDNKEQNEVLAKPKMTETGECTFNEPDVDKVDTRSPKSTESSDQTIHCSNSRPFPQIPSSPEVPLSPGTNTTNDTNPHVLLTTQTESEIQIKPPKTTNLAEQTDAKLQKKPRETPRSGLKKSDNALLINNDPPPHDREVFYASQPLNIDRHRPLPPLPVSPRLEMTNPSTEDIYIDMTAAKPSVQELSTKITARIQPLTHDRQKQVKEVSQPRLHKFQTRVPLAHPPSPGVRVVEEEEEGEDDDEEEEKEENGDGEGVYTTCKESLSGQQRTVCRKAVEDGRPITKSFFTYSVQETVDCLRLCGLTELADMCDDQTLDGDFFKRTDAAAIAEIFNLSKLQLLKLKMIYDGWRPKHLS